MKIYLDIDGVLVGRGRQPANHVNEFLETATKKHDCYWLTTHCKGEAGTVIEYLKNIFTPEMLEYCKLIRPTNWSFKKTEAIDFSSDFLWFDDQILEVEKQTLEDNKRSDSGVLVDLLDDPNHLKKLLRLL